MDDKFIHSAGVRDAIAYVLMQAWKGWNIKLPELAKEYKKKFGDHPSLNFHNS